MKIARGRARPSLLRQLNVQQIVAALQALGPTSRAEIARHTGISGPTVTRGIAALQEAGIVEEGEQQTVAVGRPGKVVRLATAKAWVAGLAVGARRCEWVVSGLDGRIDERQVIAFDTPTHYDTLLSESVARIRSLEKERGTPLRGIGISMPGLFDCREGRTLVSPNLPQTDGRRLGHDVEELLGRPASVLQECVALCLAEQVYGAARGVDHFAVLDISEGLGLGIVEGGRLLEGHRGLAGELGHITVDPIGRRCGCGNSGCLETVATDAAFVEAASQRLGRQLDIEELLAEIPQNDLANEIDSVLKYLAIGVAAVINIFNPAQLYIYGRLFDAGSDLFEQLLDRVSRRALAPSFSGCRIIRAQGNKRQGAVAAAIRNLTAEGLA